MDGKWTCSGCDVQFIGNAVKPTSIQISESGVHSFCSKCATKVKVVGNTEVIPLEDLIGTAGEDEPCWASEKELGPHHGALVQSGERWHCHAHPI